jgi:hypothetical protein
VAIARSASPIGDLVLNQAVSIGDVNVKKQALTTTEIEMLALATLAEFDERRRPVSGDSGTHFSQPKTGGRAKLHWFIETLALAGGAMAGVYVGVWLDSPDSDSSSVDTDATE